MILIHNSELEHNFVERIFDDTCCFCRLEARDYVACDAFFNDSVNRNPMLIAELRNGGRVQSRQHCEYALEVFALDVEHETHLRLSVDGAAQHEGDLIELGTFPLVGERGLACDEVGLTFHYG